MLGDKLYEVLNLTDLDKLYQIVSIYTKEKNIITINRKLFRFDNRPKDIVKNIDIEEEYKDLFVNPYENVVSGLVDLLGDIFATDTKEVETKEVENKVIESKVIETKVIESKEIKEYFIDEKLKFSDNFLLAYNKFLLLHKVVLFYSIRIEYVDKYSWARPSKIFLDRIYKHNLLNNNILAVASGNAFYELEIRHLMKELNLQSKIFITDIKSKNQHVEKLSALKAIEKYQTNTLFMSWPEYNSNMAYTTLKKYLSLSVSKYFIYIGEGSGGCTGDDNFHSLLKEDFTLIETVNDINWYCIDDVLFIYEIKK